MNTDISLYDKTYIIYSRSAFSSALDRELAAARHKLPTLDARTMFNPTRVTPSTHQTLQLRRVVDEAAGDADVDGRLLLVARDHPHLRQQAGHQHMAPRVLPTPRRRLLKNLRGAATPTFYPIFHPTWRTPQTHRRGPAALHVGFMKVLMFQHLRFRRACGGGATQTALDPMK